MRIIQKYEKRFPRCGRAIRKSGVAKTMLEEEKREEGRLWGHWFNAVGMVGNNQGQESEFRRLGFEG